MKKRFLLFIFSFFLFLSNYIFAQTYPWPLNDTDVVHRVWGNYGEYEVSSFGYYFHEGLDLIGALNTPVIAVCNGRIVEKAISPSSAQNRFIRLGVDTATGIDTIRHAFFYLHININNHKNQARPWAIGDLVSKGDTLGFIATYGIVTHLHFEYNSKENPVSWLTDSIGNSPDVYEWADLDTNPITILNPRIDNVHPWVDTVVYCRKALDEGKDNAAYFNNRTSSGHVVINNEVDLISKSGDSVGSFTNNFLCNVLKMEHKTRALKGESGYEYKKAVDFSGKFLLHADPDSGYNNYFKFRPPSSHNLSHVIFESDNTLQSHPRNTSDSVNAFPRDYYYILTNIDTSDFEIQQSDSDFYWNTKSRYRTNAYWNEIRTTNDFIADSSKSALFPDGLYEVTVRSTGYGGDPDSSTMKDTLFINNFNEYIYSCDSAGQLRDTFCIGKPVYIKGRGFPKQQSFRVYLMKDTVWTDGKYLTDDSSRIAAITIITDTAGRILPTKIWNSYQLNGYPDNGYAIVLDFDDDSLFTTAKENFTVDILDTSLGGRKAITGNLNFKKTATDISCFGDCNGTVAYELSGGHPPYNIYFDVDLISGSDTAFIDSLCPGIYYVTIIDNSCILSDTLIIEEPQPLSANCLNTYVPPCGQTGNGSVGVFAFGGTSPYYYLWNNGDTTLYLNDIPNGIYSVSVTDSMGCKDSCSIEVFTPDSMRINPDVVPVNCTNNGEIHLNITGGAGSGYMITWQLPNYFFSGGTENLIGLLDTGNYVIYANDGHGCYLQDTVHLGGNPVFYHYFLGGVINCAANGLVDLEVVGGSSFTYSWAGPNGFVADTQDIDSLSVPGYYFVNILEGSGCSARDSFYVDGRPPVYLSSILTPMNCETLGLINIDVTGGTAPFTFDWSTTWGFVSHQEDLTNLIVPGDYFIKVTDIQGCFVIDTISMTGNQRVRIFGFTNPINCNAGGAVNVFPLSGTPPFSYSWLGPDNFTSNNQNISGLSKTGMYIVTTTDHANCMHVDTFTVNGFTTPEISGTIVPVLCGEDGQISIAISGGTLPFSFNWSGPNGFNSIVQNLNNLTATGNYLVTITDAHGCTGTKSFTLNGTPGISCNATANNINCSITGSINATVTGGTPPLAFTWNGPSNFFAITQNINGLTIPGQYQFTVTDANGCFCVKNIILNGSTSIVSCALTFTNSSCAISGSVGSNIIGGTAPYNYEWSGPGGFFSTSPNLSGLTVLGGYSLVVTDNNGCTCSSSGILGGVVAPGCNAVSTNITCGSSGSIQATVIGGTSPFQYTWNGPGGFSANTLSISGLTVAGTYNLHIQDANGCICNTSAVVAISGSLTCFISPQGISCHGKNDGALTAISQSGAAPFTYLWGNNSVAQTINNLGPGNYSVTITDANGCQGFASLLLTDPQIIQITSTVSDTVCIGDTIYLNGSATGGTGNLDYYWTGSNGFSSSLNNTYIYSVTNSDSGRFILTITDDNGCTNSDSSMVYVKNCFSDITLKIKLYIQGFYSGSGYMQWSGTGCLNNLENTDPMYSPDPADVDDVTITAMDASTYAPVESKVGRLKTNGNLSVTFTGAATAGSSYYIQLTHRNLVETWSKSPVPFLAVSSYDFTLASTQAYDDGPLPMKEVEPGIWACFNGDIDHDGAVTSLDMTLEENDTNQGAYGYTATDLDGDGASTSLDMTIIENNTNIGVYSAHP